MKSSDQYHSVWCGVVQCGVVKYGAMHCSSVQWSTVQFSVVRCIAVECSAVQASKSPMGKNSEAAVKSSVDTEVCGVFSMCCVLFYVKIKIKPYVLWCIERKHFLNTTLAGGRRRGKKKGINVIEQRYKVAFLILESCCSNTNPLQNQPLGHPQWCLWSVGKP